MTLRKKLSALASSLVVGLTAYSVTPFISTAGAVEQVNDTDIKVRTELGQRSYIGEKGQKTYLKIDLEGIKKEDTERTPVNIAIVIDKSGSMSGSKLAQAKEAAIMAVERLGRDDYVSIITYSSEVDVLMPSTRVTSPTEFRHRIRNIRSNGQTALYAGTKRGIRELEAYLDANRVNRVILLSDGLANVGPSKPSDLEALGQMAGAKGISITTIGLGLGFNEDLMTKLAYASDGNHAFVRHERDLVNIFNKEFGDVLSVIAQDIEIIIECEVGIRPIRLLGRQAEISGQTIKVKLNQLYGAQSKHLIIEAELDEAYEEGDRNYANVKVDYRSMKKKSRESLSVETKINFTKSKERAEKTINKKVMSSVVEQIATEKNEQAVKLRDKGDIKRARAMLKSNADYLSKKAQSLGGDYANTLNDLAKKNKVDSENLSRDKWNASRKQMKARAYRQKTQQSY